MSELEQFLSNLNQQQILIIGDVMVDAYMWGKVNRLSPEAPVPIVSVTHREKRLGGSANVALNIRSLGAQPIICSVLGNDDEAKDFLNILYRNDLDKRGIVLSEERITTVKTRVIGNQMHIVRVDEEDTTPLTPNEEKALMDRIRKIIKLLPINAIIFQDYDKGNITPQVIDEVTALAKQKGIITTVDPKHRNFANFHDVTLFKPNLKELKEGLNIDIDESSTETMVRDLDHAASLLHERQHIEIVLITLASKGVYVCDFRNGTPRSLLIPAHLRSIADVSGAGDTVISVVTSALASGVNIESAVHFGNLAGGIVCEQVGVVPIDKDRLINELQTVSEQMQH